MKLKVLRALPYILILIGATVCVAALWSAYDTERFLRAAASTTGTVIKNIARVEKSGGGEEGKEETETYYYPWVKYRSQDGVERSFVSNTGTSPPSYEVGAQVPVVYDPNNPSHAEIRGSAVWLGTGIFTLFAFLFLGAGWGWLFWEERHKRLMKWLRANGKHIQAQFTKVELNTSVEVQDESPSRIVCQWSDPETHRVHVFKSENLWVDPEPYVKGRDHIEVIVDPRRLQRYFVDTSFVPAPEKHSLRERWREKKEEYRKRWEDMRARSFDFWLCSAFFIVAMGFLQLNGKVSRETQLICFGVLLVGLAELSLWRRRASGWRWPGAADGLWKTIPFVLGCMVLGLAILAIFFPFSNPRFTAWYALVVVLCGYNLLIEVGVVTNAKSEFWEQSGRALAEARQAGHPSRRRSKEAMWQNTVRTVYEAAFVVVWLGVISALVLPRGAEHGARFSAIKTAAEISFGGLWLLGPLLHYGFGVKLFPELGRRPKRTHGNRELAA